MCPKDIDVLIIVGLLTRPPIFPQVTKIARHTAPIPLFGMRMKAFDYIIVGAGSAGCTLENRLTEDPPPPYRRPTVALTQI